MTDTRARLDPELQPFAASFPAADLSDPVAARQKLARLSSAAPAPHITGMVIEDRMVRADPDVPVRIYRPQDAQGAIVWLHGGGFVMGDLETEHPWASRVAEGSGAVLISVGYRRAPEHRFPAALDDAYAVLAWTAEHAAELGIDPEQIAVGGHAAGAGLAAAVTLRARDEQGPPICFQLLNQPELDDRQGTWSARHFTDTPFMTRDKVAASWRHYLGSASASAYAAPARAADLGGPATRLVATAEFDPNRDEAIDYARRLLEAGVSVELHQWAGTFHGSTAVLSAEVSQRQIAELGAPCTMRSPRGKRPQAAQRSAHPPPRRWAHSGERAAYRDRLDTASMTSSDQFAPSSSGAKGVWYEVRVEGVLDARWTEWFGGLAIDRRVARLR